MKQAAITGHTARLGALIKDYFESHDYEVHGYSLSSGYDLRDYSQVGKMLEQIKNFNLFVNCAKPEYAQSQILYRLMKINFNGTILNIGTPAIHQQLGWSDLGLLEYLTQKTALFHAHQTLSTLYPGQMIMWEPQHAGSREYVYEYLDGLKL